MSEPTVSCNVSNCPTCESPGKHLHPAVQHEGEVQICGDPWHTPMPPHALTREQVAIGAFKALQCLYIAVDKAVADDVNDKVMTLVDLYRDDLTQQAQEIERVTNERDKFSDIASLMTTGEHKARVEVEHLKQALTAMTTARDEAVQKREDLWGCILEEMAENAKLFQLLDVEPEIKKGTAGTEAVVQAVAQLQATLASMTAERDEARLRRQETMAMSAQLADELHSLKKYLTASEQEAGRLRNNVELMARDMCSMPSDLYQEWLDSDSQVHFRQWLAQRALKGA